MYFLSWCLSVTGTSVGVGLGFKPSKFLEYEDEIVCKIEKIGTLKSDNNNF
jgi:2-keto-4-pentenoate hydratase/2-oxohepta-3-ene-1,7-dioic acid hydratase in catechol pathway